MAVLLLINSSCNCSLLYSEVDLLVIEETVCKHCRGSAASGKVFCKYTNIFYKYTNIQIYFAIKQLSQSFLNYPSPLSLLPREGMTMKMLAVAIKTILLQLKQSFWSYDKSWDENHCNCQMKPDKVKGFF